ncbi:hypothetical protein [Parafannyhessea umbonata]|uniref:Uncharacterized protein n=1 Tax=Parafannyhessea umbonata TaxID=604330 RepID=A0A1H1M423_9ACTN|nr:hypothetical protein [Parafannyhessea umbonata]SDR81437.1 hypothetical protein SAMN04489857_1275 [Parafannyhessea umbonata]
MGRLRYNRSSWYTTGATSHGNDAAGEKSCMLCGRHTDVVATVYLGREGGTEGDVEWRPYRRAICDECIDEQLDDGPFQALVCLALQVCWVPLFSHGVSALGIGGALVAVAGIAGLVRHVLALVWRHATEDVRSRMPKWARGDTREERASRALERIVRDDAAGSGLLVHTLGEHRRATRGDNASA